MAIAQTLKGFLGICAKNCQRNRCKDKCEGWFPNDIQLREGCKGACANDYKTLNSPQDYLCGGYVSEAEIILSRQYDPCPNSGITIQDVLEPWDLGKEEEKQNPEETENTKEALVVIVAIILAVLGLILVFKD